MIKKNNKKKRKSLVEILIKFIENQKIYKYISKKRLKKIRKERAKIKECNDILIKKQALIDKYPNNYKILRKWILNHHKKFKFNLTVRKLRRKLAKPRLPLYISFVRWVIIDFLRGKTKPFNGIYQFIALPGEGKTLSMVRHIERARKRYPELYIATNFNYKYQESSIGHWSDMIKISKYCFIHKRKCLIAIDEIHVTFDATDYKNFPAEMLAMLSFNRKYQLQFICSAQIYDRIPKKIRDIANYTVICKNVLKLDRLFITYYFNKVNYETGFSGKRKKADMLDQYVADDYLYSLYDTMEQVDRMTADAQKEKDVKQQAIDLLFGNNEVETEDVHVGAG